MSKHIFHTVLFLLLITACGTKKNIPPVEQGFGAKDFAYIEKFHQGVRYKTTGRITEAIESFQSCLQMKQDDDAVYFALSQLELMRGDLNKSSEYILKAADLDPDNTWYTQELAYMYYEQGNFEKSVSFFKKLVDLEPRNVDWQYAYAGVLQEAGKNEQSIAVLNKMEDLVGINPELSIQKYEMYMKMHDTEKAIAEIDKARLTYPKELSLLATLVDHYYRAGEEDKANNLLEELVKADPNNGRAHLVLSDIYRAKGEDAKAWLALKNAFNGEGVDVDTKLKVLMRIQETSTKLDPEAFELVDIFVNSYPTDAKAYSVKGDFLLRDGREREALEAYRKALQFDNSKFPIWNQVLIMEYQAGDYEDLYTDSKECLTLFPTMTTVYLLQGVSAIQLKKFDEAIDVLSAGRVLIVNDRSLEAEFYAQTGEAHFGLREYNTGKEAYTKAMELDPFSNLIRINYAYNLAMANMDLALAESLASEANTAAPNQAQFMDVMGVVYFRQGKIDKALEQFQGAYALNENDALIADHLGDAYAKMGNTDEAVKWWQKAKELGSKNRQLDKKLLDKKYYDPTY